MPLSQGKSKKAFSHNLKAELDAGRPRRQALAIAYEVQRRNKNKKAHGGEVSNPKLEAAHSDPKSLAAAVMAKTQRGGYASGGLVEREDDEDEMYLPEDSHPDSDFLDSDSDPQLLEESFPDDTDERMDEMSSPSSYKDMIKQYFARGGRVMNRSMSSIDRRGMGKNTGSFMYCPKCDIDHPNCKCAR